MCCQLYIFPFTKVVPFNEAKAVTHGTGPLYGWAAAVPLLVKLSYASLRGLLTWENRQLANYQDNELEP
jgi:hypothetical protein